MKRLCAVFGVAALCAGLAIAGPIQPAGVKDFHPVKGVMNVGPAVKAVPSAIHPARALNSKTLALHEGGDGGITRATEIVYDNTTTSTGYAFGSAIGDEVGDDLGATGGGVVQGAQFSLWNSSDSTANLTRVDAVLLFRDLNGDVIGGFAIDDLPVQDPNDPNDLGLPPGYSQFWTLTGLDDPNDPNNNVTVPPDVYASLIFSDVVPVAGIAELGQSMYHPPTVGASLDRFLLNIGGDPNDPNSGLYDFGGAIPADFYWQLTVDKTIDPPITAYSNITNSTGYGTAEFAGTWMGDDITLVTGGTVETVQFSMIYFQYDPTCAPQPTSPPMTQADAQVRFADINNPNTILGIAVDDTIDFGGPLDQGYGFTFTYFALDNLGITLTAQRNIIMTNFFNFVGGDQNSQLGPFLYSNSGAAPDVGSSEDQFWYDDTGAVFPPGYPLCGETIWGQAWLWFGGAIKADFYYAVDVINPIPFTLTAVTQPEVPGEAGQFWISPADDFGIGGAFNFLPADGSVQLTYSSGTGIFDLVADENSVPGRTWQKFIIRALDGPAFDIQFNSSANSAGGATPLFIATDYNAIELVFSNTIQFSALEDGLPANKQIALAAYQDPGTPILDINGQGNGVTPFTREFDPILDVADFPDPGGNYPYLWILLAAEAPDAGFELTKWVFVDQEDNTTELEMTGGDLDVNIRVEAFKSATAVYETAGEPYVCGDANCDGTADVFDIEAFVLAITDPGAYNTQFGCIDNVDTNCDSSADVFDIASFVDTITGANPCNCQP